MAAIKLNPTHLEDFEAAKNRSDGADADLEVE